MLTEQRSPPYGAYAGIVGTFAGAMAAAGALGRLLDRDPQCQTALDFTVLSLASSRPLEHSLGMRSPASCVIRSSTDTRTRAARSPSSPAIFTRRSASWSPAAAASAPGRQQGSRRRRYWHLASAGFSPGRLRRPARTTFSRRLSPR